MLRPVGVLPGLAARPSLLDEHEGYVRQRIGGGCRNAGRIHRELRGSGCPRCPRGKTIVKGLVRRLLAEEARPSSLGPRIVADRGHPTLLSFHQLAIAIIRKPGYRSAEETLGLAALGAGDDELRPLMAMAERFAAMVRDRRPTGFSEWLDVSERSTVAKIRLFARRLRQDEAAVRAGMELEWSNGPTEGHVGRLKLIKRTMYGRAGFDLLRARVLHAG
jgi:transposase